MKDLKQLGAKFQKKISEIIVLGTRHRFVLIFIILGAAIGFALLRTQSFIDIPRNENRYNEGVQTINYKTIDQKTLEAFKNVLNDQQVQVDSKYDSDRNNPFID